MRKISLRINLMFIVLILVLVSVFSTFLMIFDANNVGTGLLNTLGTSIVSPSNVADATLDTHYKAFASGSTYVFTDKDKVDEFRAGNIESDTTTIVVDRSEPHGSQKNPYVIDKNGWNDFATDINSRSDHGVDKYFVLAEDIDFAGGKSPKIADFGGTFYGLGHTISNVEFYVEYNNAILMTIGGLFYTLSNTVIFADLNVKDYSANGGVGTIAGYANSNCGDVIFLNCHTDGIVSNIDGGFHGGLMGSTNMSATLMSYKCSTKIRGTAYSAGTSWSSGIGGVVGYMGNGGKLKVYDFYGDNEANVIVTSGGSYSGLVAGCITISSIDLDGIIGRHYVKTTGTQNYYFDGGVATIYVPNSMSFGDWSVKNTYITAQHDFSNGTASFIPYFIGAPTASYSNFRGNQITSNVHYASDAQSVYTHTSGKEVFTSSLGLAHETYGTSGLWDAAKNDNNFNEKIWDKDKIGTQDILNESPVKNSAITIQDFKIQYRNLKIVDGEAVLEKLTGVEDITYNLGESVTHPIPTTAAVDHKFAGWTLYKDTEVFADSSTPTDLYGDVIFYAVWDVENAVGNVTADKTTIEYSTGYLTLTANISVKNIAEPNIVYKWYHNGTEVKGAVSKNLMIDEVNESGSYSLEYTIRDKIEPLWRVTAKTDSIDVEITKGELSIKKFAISESTIPYTGKPIPEIEFSATIINSAGDEVEGTVSWQYNTGNVAEGINTRNINFRPNDKDNYNAENILQVEFEAKYLQLVFEIPDLTGKFSVNLTYNQNYSANKIRDMFISGYLKFLDENPGAAAAAQNMTPKLDGVFIDDYNTTFTKVQDNVTIQVTLAQKDYVVTFDPQNGIAPTTQNYHYGNYLLEPAKPTNGALLFLGWYWEKPTESGGTEETRWDFEQDVVTDDVTIFAKWLDEFDLESISVSANRNVNALSQISKGDITVTAHLTAEGGFEQDVKLLWGEYSIKYASPDGLLHVSNSNITVEYTVAGVTKTASLEVPVTPVKIDTTGLRFENKSFAYDGLAHTIIIAGQLPLEIANVSYEYFRGATSIGSDGAINIGIYTVVATFEVIDTDYVAEQMRATLTITRNENEVKVKWDNNSLTYNGQEQHPTVHIFDSEDREITSDLEIEFVYTQGDGICAGSHTVEVTIKTNGYKIVDGASKTYMIAKKQLQLPTLEEEIIYTGLEQSIEDILKGYDTAAMNIGGDISSTNVGKYRATITLIDSKNYSWSAGTSTNIDWEIKPLHLTAEWDAFEFLHDNTEHSPRVKGLIGIIESDLTQVDFENDFVYTLPPQINVGSYTTIVNFNNNVNWTKNYVLDGNAEWSYVIVPKNGMTIISIEWSNTELVYNKKIQYPSFIVKDKDGNDITEIVKNQLILDGDYKTSKWEGDYEINVALSDSNDKYFIRQGATCKYHISADENGGGSITDPEHPDNPNNTDNPDKPNEDNGFKLPENFPLWQFIVGGIALILAIAFLAKAGTNDSKRRKFKSKTKAVQKSYSIVATPLIVMAAAYLGLEQNIWTILACIMIGFCVVGFALMLGTGHALKKAEAGYETALEEKKAAEDAKIAERNAEIERKREEEQQKRDEEQRRRDEEQRKRDEEMKMMFMAMMNKQGSSGDGNGYASVPIEEIVAKTVAAIMPSMQTLMITDHSSVDNETMTKLLEQQEKLIAKLMENQSIAATANQFIDDDEDEDDEEMSWDDEEDEEEVDEITPVEMVTPTGEVVVTEATVKKVIKLPANFRARLKMSSDKNREAYVSLKNLLCSKRGLTFRVCGRVEKVKYKGELIAVIGVATKHIKLWLALDPTAFDKRRYFHKDVSDKIRYAQVPMLFKISSERALDRAFDLIDALCEKFDIETKRKYTEKSLQVLAYTLKHNAILKLKKTELLCESIHVHDTDIMNNDEVSECIERRGIEAIEEENFATIKLDDIDKNFVDGQKVTLDALKRKELVDENCNGFKVVAGTRLTKPLIIMANEFTISAVKMIVLTGGRAILLVQQNQ